MKHLIHFNNLPLFESLANHSSCPGGRSLPEVPSSLQNTTPLVPITDFPTTLHKFPCTESGQWTGVSAWTVEFSLLNQGVEVSGLKIYFDTAPLPGNNMKLSIVRRLAAVSALSL